MYPGHQVFQKEFQKDLLYIIILLIKTALLFRIKVGVRLRDCYRTSTEFFKFLPQQEVLFNESMHLH